MFANKKRKPKNRGRSRRKNNSGTLLITAIAALVIAIVGGLVYLGIEYIDANHPDEFGCYEQTDQHQTAILVDYSLIGQSETQFRDYAIGALADYDRTPANGRVHIAVSARDVHSNLLQPVFTICKPATTKTEQLALGIPADGKLVRERKAVETRDAFIAKMDEVIAGARDQDKRAKNSPLLELVRALSRAPWFQGSSRRASIIMDGIQNNRVAQFCAAKGHMPSFANFAKKPEYRRIKPDSFVGTDVTVLMVEIGVLPNKDQPYCSGLEEVRQWWENYFLDNGADNVAIEPLDYGVGE